MSSGANVKSVEALQRFREGLVTYCEMAVDGLLAAELEARRTLDWLERDQQFFWTKALRDRSDEVALAKSALARKLLREVNGRPPDVTEEKKALALAKFRVEEAEQKLEAAKKWTRAVQKELEEYVSQARQLGDLVEGNPARTVVVLDRIIGSLAKYLEEAVPTAEILERLARAVSTAGVDPPANPNGVTA